MSFGQTRCTTHAFTLCFADSLRRHDAAGVPSAADRLLAQVISSLSVSLLIEGARNVDSCTGLQVFLVQNTFVVGTVLWCQVYASGTFVRRLRGPYSSWLHGVDPSAIATAVVESHFVCAPSCLRTIRTKRVAVDCLKKSRLGFVVWACPQFATAVLEPHMLSCASTPRSHRGDG